MALAKIVAEELTKDACTLSVGHDMMRFLTNFIATLRGTTERHDQDFFLIPDTNTWLFEYAVEATTKYRCVTKHPINRTRLGTLDGSVGPMRLVYPGDADVTDAERALLNGFENIRRQKATVWLNRNVPLPWMRPDFGIASTRDRSFGMPSSGSAQDRGSNETIG